MNQGHDKLMHHVLWSLFLCIISRLKIGSVLYKFISLSVQTTECLELLKILPIVHVFCATPIQPQWKDDDQVLNDIREKCKQQRYVVLLK